jgi:hypothetical protein
MTNIPALLVIALTDVLFIMAIIFNSLLGLFGLEAVYLFFLSLAHRFKSLREL